MVISFLWKESYFSIPFPQKPTMPQKIMTGTKFAELNWMGKRKGTHWKRPWFWERLKAGGKGNDRGWDGWMASPTQWAFVWASSGSWWWTGKPGMLQSLGWQSQTWLRLNDWTEHQKHDMRDVPGGAVDRTLCSHARDLGSITGQGTKSPHTTTQPTQSHEEHMHNEDQEQPK